MWKIYKYMLDRGRGRIFSYLNRIPFGFILLFLYFGSRSQHFVAGEEFYHTLYNFNRLIVDARALSGFSSSQVADLNKWSVFGGHIKAFDLKNHWIWDTPHETRLGHTWKEGAACFKESTLIVTFPGKAFKANLHMSLSTGLTNHKTGLHYFNWIV